MPSGVYERTEETRKKMKKRKGSKNGNWKGGRKKNNEGYILIYTPTHLYHDKQNYVYEHRLVMEKHLGKTLLPTEVVHHINGIVDDNRIENLMLFSNYGEHIKFHRKIQNEMKEKKGGK